jgi:alpha-D-ribose 1-methylphosphonate 5-triphosphate synthase subunit PhnG
MAQDSLIDARKHWLGVLAKCDAASLVIRCAALSGQPAYAVLRAPEIGSVMVRGRAGATGAAFNLGEMTVTRCSIQLETGEEGHAYVQGRDKEKARAAALVDAMMQTDAADSVRQAVLDPLEAAHRAATEARAARAAATKVDFFTMARGED